MPNNYESSQLWVTHLYHGVVWWGDQETCARWRSVNTFVHYDDVIVGAIGSLITSLTIVYSTVYSNADQRKHQSSASLAFVWGIHRGPVNSPHNWPVTRKMFSFDDVIMLGHKCYGNWYRFRWMHIVEVNHAQVCNEKCTLYVMLSVSHITWSVTCTWLINKLTGIPKDCYSCP